MKLHFTHIKKRKKISENISAFENIRSCSVTSRVQATADPIIFRNTGERLLSHETALQ